MFVWKDENKQKEAGNGHLKKFQFVAEQKKLHQRNDLV